MYILGLGFECISSAKRELYEHIFRTIFLFAKYTKCSIIQARKQNVLQILINKNGVKSCLFYARQKWKTTKKNLKLRTKIRVKQKYANHNPNLHVWVIFILIEIYIMIKCL